MTRFKAIIFDLDGTLCEYQIDSFAAFLKAFEVAHAVEALEEHADIFDAENYKAQLKAIWRESKTRVEAGEANPFPYGASVENVARLLAQAGIGDEQLSQRIQDAYLDTMLAHLCLRDGAKSVVNALEKQYQLGLLTNGPSQLQWGKIKRLNIRAWFDGIVVSDDIGIRKPDARIFRVLLEQMDVLPQQAVYVGDTLEYDVQGANNAALTSVWLNTRGDVVDERSPKPDVQIAHLKELLGWLKL